MKLNKSQLKIFLFISKRLITNAKDISSSLKISQSLAYLDLSRLETLNLIDKINEKIKISQKKFARDLANLLNEDETLMETLANLGIPILSILTEKHNLIAIANETKTSAATIYPYLRKLIKRNIIKKEKKEFVFNKELWDDLYQFIILYHEDCILNKFNVPNNAKTYYLSEEEAIFSLPIEYKEATKTAFSSYEKYGIRLFEKEIYYRLPINKKINEKIILLDSFKVSKNSARKKLYCYLFYLKNQKKLKRIKSEELEIFKNIIKDNKKYPDYPTKEEIIEKADDYDIQI